MSERFYLKSHEWVAKVEAGLYKVGISNHAQEALGDIVYVELPEENTTLKAGDDCSVIESVKAASDIYAPISGVVASINQEVADSPEIINEDPYEAGWLFTIRTEGEPSLTDLLTEEQYAEILKSE